MPTQTPVRPLQSLPVLLKPCSILLLTTVPLPLFQDINKLAKAHTPLIPQAHAQHTSNTHQPCSQLKLFYFNTRSIVPKLDELLTLVQCEHPDVICIVESWLNSDNLDSEISISPGYQVFPKDRNRHGGGVLVYACVELDCRTIDHLLTWNYCGSQYIVAISD